jgi:hypothetical protein
MAQKKPHGWLRGATNREAKGIIHDYRNNARHENAVAPSFQVRYDLQQRSSHEYFRGQRSKN